MTALLSMCIFAGIGLLLIDGDYYTTAQVAKRLSVSLTTAQRRLRTRSHTWEALK